MKRRYLTAEEQYRYCKSDGTPTGGWFSWGWLIFWILVFFPVAIVYILVKLGDRWGGRRARA